VQQTGRAAYEGGGLSTLSWMEFLPLTRALGRDLVGTDPQAVALDVQQTVEAADGVLLLDDLQWAAPATVDVVKILAGRLPLAVGVRTGTRTEEQSAASLAEAGFTRICLRPLDPDAAAEVARQLRPQLSDRELATVVHRAGGNPLLLRELAESGEASTSLQRTVAARLRRLTAAEREAFAMLALAGSVPRAMFAESTVADLDAAGLVVSAAGRLEVRHALLGEAAVDSLNPARRRDLHRKLGERLSDPGEAARHFDLAGERDSSRQAALRAAELAERPGERASHLRVAAMNSTGAAADDLRLAAAESLEAAHDWEGVFAVLDQVVGSDSSVQARAALVRARAAWSGGRLDDLRPALEVGLDAAAGLSSSFIRGGDVGVLLRIEACRVPIFADGDFEAGVVQAREALALATKAGVGKARAEYFLGTALAGIDQPGGAEHLERAIEEARAAADVSTELTSANNLIAYHESSGSPGVGADLARQVAERSRALGLGGWEANFTYQALQLDFHAGRYDGLIEAIEELEARPLDVRTRDSLLELHCMVLADTGRADEAMGLAEQALIQATPDQGGRPHLWWAHAEAALWAGDPRRAKSSAERFLTELPEWNINRVFGLVTLAWARFDLGEDPGPPAEDLDRPLLLAVPHETSALAAAYAGRFDVAVDEFRIAAELWAPYHVRGELRCEWATGEAHRRAGELDDAIRTLTMVEKRSADAGMVAVLNRAQLSLRAAGERRTAARARGVAGLTGREQQVLDLVAQGLTNGQIAARLGTTRRTVVAQIASASAKLGADNRLHAAALAAGLAAER
jgi:DNA-binding CsgD family transcriptional regulator